MYQREGTSPPRSSGPWRVNTTVQGEKTQEKDRGVVSYVRPRSFVPAAPCRCHARHTVATRLRTRPAVINCSRARPAGRPMRDHTATAPIEDRRRASHAAFKAYARAARGSLLCGLCAFGAYIAANNRRSRPQKLRRRGVNQVASSKFKPLTSSATSRRSRPAGRCSASFFPRVRSPESSEKNCAVLCVRRYVALVLCM